MNKLIIVLLLLGAGVSTAAPPPQKLARTLPPEIVALIASNAPPNAHISYKHYRAKPFMEGRSYKQGDVVTAPDGTAYIATCNIIAFGAPIVPMSFIKSQKQAVYPHVSPIERHAAYFRAINVPITNAAPSEMMVTNAPTAKRSMQQSVKESL